LTVVKKQRAIVEKLKEENTSLKDLIAKINSKPKSQNNTAINFNKTLNNIG
jgi:hypothetical protein